MPQSLTRKLIDAHLVAGKAVAGEEIGVRADQILLTDTNGIQSWLQFEAMGFPRVVPPRVVTYIDHQVFQVDSRNSDDHRYMQTASRKYGAVFRKPGNGTCHQVHMETYSIPGQMVLGSDSHTPLCGAAGMLAIGAGGLDVAVAMGGGPYFLTMPTVVRVWLTGQLQPWVTAKDVILELLRRYSVRGGSGKIFEYAGPGVKSLLAAQRMTIANMGAELGLTTSVFPSDEVTRSFLTRLGRGDDWRPAQADDDAEYDAQIELDLSAVTPLVALPGSPDKVVPVEEVAGTAIEQVMVGSCTNGSWHDMASVTSVVRGRRVHPSLSFVLFPGSHRILETMACEGLLADLLAAGVLGFEPIFGSCAGLGHVPATGSKSLRAFNRNLSGRRGVTDDQVSTDDISPAGAAALMFRSNVPAIAEFCFKYVDPQFVARARAAGPSLIVGGELYGQGSSREVAAIAPMFLGVRAVIVKSFARIHRANLVNWGVVPLTFDDPTAYDGIERDDRLRVDDLRASVAAGARVRVVNERTGAAFTASCVLTPREREILLAGGLLAHTKGHP